MIKIALVGNPNSGKTTVFNALTGSRQRVGNWPGVTVEKREGYYTFAEQSYSVVDLPGTYSLTVVDAVTSLDERIACQHILDDQADLVLNIIDGTNLERNLYLSTQVLEMRVPLVLVVNMCDIVNKRGITLDLDVLSKKFGCPVIGINGKSKQDIQRLRQFIADLPQPYRVSPALPPYPSEILEARRNIMRRLYELDLPEDHVPWLAFRLLEDDAYLSTEYGEHAQVAEQQASIRHALREDADILMAEKRYKFARELVAEMQSQVKPSKDKSAWLDKIILNRTLGLPIFFAVMYAMFVFAINISGALQDFFDIASHTLFVDGVQHGLHALGAPAWISSLLAGGVGVGINTTLTFIPVIGGMFLFLAFLEDSGYMARAVFVVDRLMRCLGLPGRAFVPLIVGFGCNVPGVMAARTLSCERERILTIMMAPFMSCGARLAIFAVFTRAFFPQGGQNIVFCLYLIGIVFAVITGFLLRHTLLPGKPSPLILELPPYHMPSVRGVLLHAWQRLRQFLLRAGKLILPLCVVLGALNSLSVHGTFITQDAGADSLLSWVGRLLTPLFAPMGITQDNWPATVGLATGILAKEVVVATLNTLYMQAGHLVQSAGAAGFDLWGGLLEAWQSIFVNFSEIKQALFNPVLANAASTEVNHAVYGIMYERFVTPAAAFAYLLFVLLYVPCVSTTAVMVRELNKQWAWFSVLWSTGSAYALAVIFYQAATWSQHPLRASVWIALMLGAFVVVFVALRRHSFTTHDEHSQSGVTVSEA